MHTEILDRPHASKHAATCARKMFRETSTVAQSRILLSPVIFFFFGKARALSSTAEMGDEELLRCYTLVMGSSDRISNKISALLVFYALLFHIYFHSHCRKCV